MDKYSVIDLFAGAGGLSLGFMQTNKYDIKVAFENNPDMQATYKKNHPNVEVLGDVCKANYQDIIKKYGMIDVVIGGPPCQGFSNANRQKNHAVSQNNMLVKQYIRAILEIKPKAFVMENVSMLCSEVHRFYMEHGDESTVIKYGISVKNTPIHLLDTRFLFDSAIDIVQSETEIEKYLWTEEDYSELNVIYKSSKNITKLKKAFEKHKTKLLRAAETQLKNKSNDYITLTTRKAFKAIKSYYNGKMPLENIAAIIEPAIMIQRMLSKAKEIFQNNLLVDSYSLEDGLFVNIRSFAVFDYLKSILSGPENNYVINSGVICAADYGAPQKRKRFVVMGIKRSIAAKVALPKGRYDEDEYRTVRDAIADLETIQPVYDIEDDEKGIKIDSIDDLSDLAASLRNSKVLRNHIITKTTDTAMERFKVIKQGQNFHSLDEKLKTNTYTDVSRTQNTIYLRLNYDEPSGTVVNVRKSMWIHPTLNRAISVREAARLQTFPDSFIFCGTKDKQYQQVGNAVPPIMAKSIAKKLAQTLTKNLLLKEDNG